MPIDIKVTVQYGHKSPEVLANLVGLSAVERSDFQDAVLATVAKMNAFSRSLATDGAAVPQGVKPTPHDKGEMKVKQEFTNDGQDGGEAMIRSPRIEAGQYEFTKGLFVTALAPFIAKHGQSGKHGSR